MPRTFLSDRGVVRVAGADACSFLQGLVTCDMAKAAPGRPVFGALLTPQGKITADFIISEADGAYFLDCPLALAEALAKRLGFYKLRARAEVSDISAAHGVAASWGADFEGEADPRNAGLGGRVLGERAALERSHGVSALSLYQAHRIGLGIPQGGLDFAYGDAFPHEANLDLLHGVDFKKGCYVGQEVVSRVEHRGAARKRIVPVHFEGAPDGAAPAPGTPVRAGEIEVGMIGSAAGSEGLASLRVDRAREAAKAGVPLTAGGTRLRVPSIEA